MKRGRDRGSGRHGRSDGSDGDSRSTGDDDDDELEEDDAASDERVGRFEKAAAENPPDDDGDDIGGADGDDIGSGDDDREAAQSSADRAAGVRRVYGQEAVADQVECALKNHLHVMFAGAHSGIGKSMLLDNYCRRLVCTAAALEWAENKVARRRQPRDTRTARVRLTHRQPRRGVDGGDHDGGGGGGGGGATRKKPRCDAASARRHAMQTFCLELTDAAQSMEGVTDHVRRFVERKYADEPRGQVRVVRVRVCNRLSRVFQEALRCVMERPRIVFAFETASLESIEPPFQSRVVIVHLRPLSAVALAQLLSDAAVRMGKSFCEERRRRAAAEQREQARKDARALSAVSSITAFGARTPSAESLPANPPPRSSLTRLTSSPSSPSPSPSLPPPLTSTVVTPFAAGRTSKRAPPPPRARPSLIKPLRAPPSEPPAVGILRRLIATQSPLAASFASLRAPAAAAAAAVVVVAPKSRVSEHDAELARLKSLQPVLPSLEFLADAPRFLDRIVAYADGDARIALRALETAGRRGAQHVAHLVAIHRPCARAARRVLDACFVCGGSGGGGEFDAAPLEKRASAALAAAVAFDRAGFTVTEFVECAVKRLRTQSVKVAREAPLALVILRRLTECQRKLQASSCPSSSTQLFGLVSALLASSRSCTAVAPSDGGGGTRGAIRPRESAKY